MALGTLGNGSDVQHIYKFGIFIYIYPLAVEAWGL
jgi:hypothetical protein